MKKLIAGFILLSLSGMAFADSQAYNLSKEAEAKENWESRMESAAHKTALMTDVKINCSSAGQSKIKELVSGFNGELKERYEDIFSCEGAIEKALDDGISESEIREELDL